MKAYELAIAVCFLFVAVYTVRGQTQTDAKLTANPVYVKDCAKCHGTNAEGRHFRGPSLTSEKAAAASEQDLRTIITKGKGHMPKFAGKLTPDEIDTLVQQIEALNKK